MTVTKADTTTAKKLHKELIKGRKITLKIKGTKANAKKIVKNLNNKLKKINKVGVIFQYDSIKTSNGVTSVVIKKATAKNYNYACAFFKRIWTLVKLDNAYYVESAKLNGRASVLGSTATEDEERLFNLITNTENFCDLSDIVKVYVLSESDYFTCDYDHSDSSHNDVNGVYFGMIYVYESTAKNSLKDLLYDNASGVCEDYARAEILTLKQLGITAYFNGNSSWNHAWSVVQAKNSDGKLITVPFDYYLIVDNNSSTITSKNAYAIYTEGLNNMPKKRNNYLKNFY
jgi:hypothetical protein